MRKVRRTRAGRDERAGAPTAGDAPAEADGDDVEADEAEVRDGAATGDDDGVDAHAVRDTHDDEGHDADADAGDDDDDDDAGAVVGDDDDDAGAVVGDDDDDDRAVFDEDDDDDGDDDGSPPELIAVAPSSRWARLGGALALVYVLWAVGDLLLFDTRPATFNAVHRAANHPVARVAFAAVFLGIVFHGLNGLRLTLTDLVPRLGRHDVVLRAVVRFLTFATWIPVALTVLWPSVRAWIAG